MAFIVADRTRDTATTTGTGNFTVSGLAPSTYQTFAAVCANNDTFPYFIANQNANEWEVGLATYNSTNIVVRTAGNVVSGSAGAATLVNFSAGTKDVVLGIPSVNAYSPVNANAFVDYGDPTSGTALAWFNAGSSTLTYSFYFNKSRDATNARHWAFADCGGLTGDGAGGAFWRGLFISGPPITDPVGGGFVFPTFSMYFEYATLTTPAARTFAFDVGNVTSSTLHTYRIRSGNVDMLVLAPTSTSIANQIQIQVTPSGSSPQIAAVGSDTNVNLLLAGQGTGTIEFSSSSSWSANGTVATALTSLGPTGANTTVQEWLTVLDNNGTTRYIPCF